MTDDAEAMNAVTIPADLAADVAAHPDRYRPAVAEGQMVLGLADPVYADDPNDEDDDPEWGVVGGVYPANHILDHEFNAGDEDYGCISVNLGGGRGRIFAAWALVGSVDGGPRPGDGDRVVVLESLDGTTARDGLVATVVRDHDRSGEQVNGIMVTHGNAAGSSVTFWATRWAILPSPAALWADNFRDYEGDTFQFQGGAVCINGNMIRVVADPSVPPGVVEFRSGDHVSRRPLPPGALPSHLLARSPHESVPTREAYDAAVAALEKHRARADRLRDALERIARSATGDFRLQAIDDIAREALDATP